MVLSFHDLLSFSHSTSNFDLVKLVTNYSYIIFILLAFSFLYDSPVWYLRRNKEEKARKALQQFRLCNDEKIYSEYKDLHLATHSL